MAIDRLLIVFLAIFLTSCKSLVEKNAVHEISVTQNCSLYVTTEDNLDDLLATLEDESGGEASIVVNNDGDIFNVEYCSNIGNTEDNDNLSYNK